MIPPSRRFSVIFVALVICAPFAHAQTAKLLPSRADGQSPPGIKVIQPGITSAAQTVIPRYVSGANFPAGQIIGWGPQSIIAATSATATTGPRKAVVITEDYGKAISQWQHTQSTGVEPAVLQPILRDLTIAGYSENNWGPGGAVNDTTQLWNKTDKDQYAGLLANATGGRLENVTIYFIPGTAAYITHPGSLLGASTGPFDRLKWNVQGLFIRRVFRGLWMNATDSVCTDIEVAGFRDYGVRLGQFRAGGAVQFARLHAYGGGMLAADNTALARASGNAAGLSGVDSPALWIDGDTCHGVDCYGESAPVGLYIKGSYAALDGFYSHTCSVANVVLAGSYNHIAKARVDVLDGRVGVNFTNQYNTLTDSTIHPAGSSTAIVLNNGTNQTLRDVVIGSFGNPASTGIDANATLINCRFQVHVTGGGTALDLVDGGTVPQPQPSTLNPQPSIIFVTGGTSRIGTGNVIHLTTSNGTTVKARLPAGWSTTPSTTTNEIVIDGVRYYPP